MNSPFDSLQRWRKAHELSSVNATDNSSAEHLVALRHHVLDLNVIV